MGSKKRAGAFKPAASKSGLTTFFSPEVREWQVERLFGLTNGQGWGHALPRLKDRVEDKSPTAAVIQYEVQNLTVAMHWHLEERDWQVAQIVMPIPSAGPIIDRFLKAWNQSDVHDMSSFFIPDFRERMVNSLQNSLKNRQWEAFPAIESREVVEVGQETVQLRLKTDGGKIRADWVISPQGGWCLQRVVFPEPVKKRMKRTSK
ncbi:MAG: hypothetical protein ACI8TQ_001184 [Planctomycetota bacterium]